jgi:hypothetical protein
MAISNVRARIKVKKICFLIWTSKVTSFPRGAVRFETTGDTLLRVLRERESSKYVRLAV